jgi:D-lactate dehydrogenase
MTLIFRSGGTSLSGQAVSDGLLVDTRKRFRGVTVLDSGMRVVCQRGATVRQVNVALARYHRKLGPDPASEVACTIGGVVANNSSGMACGTEFNTYRTLTSMIFVLTDGTMINTAIRTPTSSWRTIGLTSTKASSSCAGVCTPTPSRWPPSAASSP